MNIKAAKSPNWVKDVERTPSGTLLIVEGRDGKRRGICIPNKPIRPVIEDRE